ncbi:fumarylacetoacetate hydrolase family protein [Frondihabitans cladoniiphilus]|uniref:Fumarylacetoacetate hydrolase family protein n=1 Tax=Frondihabitans cladoniiphilus TaxID=715785 RepID=A0ABP8WB06_9MICO
MKLGTLRTGLSTTAVRVDDDSVVEIAGFDDVGALLQEPEWSSIARDAEGPSRRTSDVAPKDWAPVVTRPSKIVCVGLNYANHIREMGRELPEFPTLFAKYPEALIGPFDDIVLPSYAAQALDWEAELALVIGAPARRLEEEEALSAIAGFTVINDVTMRDFQYRTPEWFQGKTFEDSTPLGPFLTLREDYRLGTELQSRVDGEVMQSATTDDLVFGPAALVSYISKIVTLNPGDVIATGTPGGVGHARKPPRYLTDGAVLTTSIEGLGILTNAVRVEA